MWWKKLPNLQNRDGITRRSALHDLQVDILMKMTFNKGGASQLYSSKHSSLPKPLPLRKCSAQWHIVGCNALKKRLRWSPQLVCDEKIRVEAEVHLFRSSEHGKILNNLSIHYATALQEDTKAYFGQTYCMRTNYGGGEGYAREPGRNVVGWCWPTKLISTLDRWLF